MLFLHWLFLQRTNLLRSHGSVLCSAHSVSLEVEDTTNAMAEQCLQAHFARHLLCVRTGSCCSPRQQKVQYFDALMKGERLRTAQRIDMLLLTAFIGRAKHSF